MWGACFPLPFRLTSPSLSNTCQILEKAEHRTIKNVTLLHHEAPYCLPRTSFSRKKTKWRRQWQGGSRRSFIGNPCSCCPVPAAQSPLHLPHLECPPTSGASRAKYDRTAVLPAHRTCCNRPNVIGKGQSSIQLVYPMWDHRRLGGSANILPALLSLQARELLTFRSFTWIFLLLHLSAPKVWSVFLLKVTEQKEGANRAMEQRGAAQNPSSPEL